MLLRGGGHVEVVWELLSEVSACPGIGGAGRREDEAATSGVGVGDVSVGVNVGASVVAASVIGAVAPGAVGANVVAACVIGAVAPGAGAVGASVVVVVAIKYQWLMYRKLR